MKILIIGGAGYIGSVLVRELLSKNHKVRVFDNFTFGENSLLDLKNHPSLDIINADTRHIDKLSSAMIDTDAVIHLGELVGDPACGINSKTTYDINYLATHMIAFICKHYKIKRFIYMSSCSVYGASEDSELLNEKSLLNPVSLYARVKIASERVLLNMANKDFMPTILRMSTLFGMSYRPRFDLVVNLLTAKAIIDKELHIFGGKQWRPLLHVKDVAYVITQILDAPIEKVGNEVFNIGAENMNYTIGQVGHTIANLFPDAKLVIDHTPDKRDYRIDFSKAENILHFKPTMSLFDGILEINNAFLEGRIQGNYSDPIYNNYDFLKDKLI